MENFKFLIKKDFSKLPKNSGIYCFKDKAEKFLYIGKANNLKERIKNHFQQTGFKENIFLEKVHKIGYLKTDSEITALILEADLIKKYQPKYNVIWRDDKNYFYIEITKEDFPRVFITHQPKIQSSFVGPFVDGKALKQTLKILRKVFPYRSCKTLPKSPCLWYQLGRCPAPCLLNLDRQIQIKKECQQNTKNLLKILQGKKTQVLKNLKREMKEASVIQDFERAAKIRDQIIALEKVISQAKIFGFLLSQKRKWAQIQMILKKFLKVEKKISRIEAYDVSNIQGQEATGSMVTFVNGQPDKKFYRKFKIKTTRKSDDLAMIREIIERRFSHPQWPYPDLIIVDGGKTQLKAAQVIINNYQLTIPVIALAKKRSEAKSSTKLRFRAGENKLFIEGKKEPILLRSLPREIFNLVLQMRDEAHRFALSYHRKLRKNLIK